VVVIYFLFEYVFSFATRFSVDVYFLTRRSLPNIAHLKIGITNNSKLLHVDEIRLMEFDFLQRIQVYSQNRHTSLETLIAKNSSVLHVAWKRLIDIVSSQGSQICDHL
jgi:hypothetical protein